MSEEKVEGYKKREEKKGIIWQFLFGLWFLFWSGVTVWLVYKGGFIPTLTVMLALCIAFVVFTLAYQEWRVKEKG